MKTVILNKSLALQNSNTKVIVSGGNKVVKVPTALRMNSFNSQIQRSFTTKAKVLSQFTKNQQNVIINTQNAVQLNRSRDQLNMSQKSINQGKDDNKSIPIKQATLQKTPNFFPNYQQLFQKINKMKLNQVNLQKNQQPQKIQTQANKEKESEKISQKQVSIKESLSQTQLYAQMHENKKQKQQFKPQSTSQFKGVQKSQVSKATLNNDIQLNLLNSSFANKINQSFAQKSTVTQKDKEPVRQVHVKPSQNDSLNRILNSYQKKISNSTLNTSTTASAHQVSQQKKNNLDSQTQDSKCESPSNTLKISQFEQKLRDYQTKNQDALNQTMDSLKNLGKPIQRNNQKKPQKDIKSGTKEYKRSENSVNTSILNDHNSQTDSQKTQMQKRLINLSYDDLDADFPPKFIYQSQGLNLGNLRQKYLLLTSKQQRIRAKGCLDERLTFIFKYTVLSIRKSCPYQILPFYIGLYQFIQVARNFSETQEASSVSHSIQI